MYQDSGMYRNQQYVRAEAVTLQTMYEEIALLWAQELKYRPSFSVSGDRVTVPVLLEKVCGVKDGDVRRYWSEIKKLLTPDTVLVDRLPWLSPTDENPIKPYVTQFLKNGKLLRDKIRNHKSYPYGILRKEMQEFLPQQLTAEELAEEVKAIISETGASSIKDMGRVMGVASKRLAGRADGKDISAKVRELLA